MTEYVTDSVAEGIDAIKASGRCNIQDHATVAKIATKLGFDDLAAMISKDADKYHRCITHGFVTDKSSKKSAKKKGGLLEDQKQPKRRGLFKKKSN